MSTFQKYDKNFLLQNSGAKEGTVIYDVTEAPFVLHGIFPPKDDDSEFYRLPLEVAKKVSEGVFYEATQGAGGRVRFKTDSSYIGLKVIMGEVAKANHFSLSGTAGFDLYRGRKHIHSFIPDYSEGNESYCECKVLDPQLSDYTINFTTYSKVKKVYIVLDKDAKLEAPDPYKYEKPIVFYGSSITQGGCASRPGTVYSAILSRKYDFDYINLGFSGCAKGEKEMADYIAGLDMSVFVYDYDHNAPTAEHLKETHEPFFKIIREKHPDIPIICMTRPNPYPVWEPEKKKEIIKQTVENAKARGDKNVYYVDVSGYLEKHDVLNESIVDKAHPNDLGFYFMACAVEEVLKNIL